MTPAETVIGRLIRLAWLSEAAAPGGSEPGLRLTDLGRALLRDVMTGDEDDEDVSVVVLGLSDPLAYPILVGQLAAAGPGLLVDPYLNWRTCTRSRSALNSLGCSFLGRRTTAERSVPCRRILDKETFPVESKSAPRLGSTAVSSWRRWRHPYGRHVVERRRQDDDRRVTGAVSGAESLKRIRASLGRATLVGPSLDESEEDHNEEMIDGGSWDCV